MPTYVTGDIWQSPESHGATVIAVPSNAVINRKGELVMGAGFALAARERWPWLPSAAGAVICQMLNMPMGKRPAHEVLPFYGWAALPLYIGRTPQGELVQMALFQTKEDYRHGSNPAIIYYSVYRLAEWLRSHPTEIVALPMPGVGLGGLKRRDVMPVLSVMPERVIVFEREGGEG